MSTANDIAVDGGDLNNDAIDRLLEMSSLDSTCAQVLLHLSQFMAFDSRHRNLDVFHYRSLFLHVCLQLPLTAVLGLLTVSTYSDLVRLDVVVRFIPEIEDVLIMVYISIALPLLNMRRRP